MGGVEVTARHSPGNTGSQCTKDWQSSPQTVTDRTKAVHLPSTGAEYKVKVDPVLNLLYSPSLVCPCFAVFYWLVMFMLLFK